ncbi:sulfite exporter TauE/SafE family protein [Sandaracinobacteroides sp. A072]|uniref:sulfite exporter TauE/SafE family protein n=1 Tax=Sandaracinobacteroides sp. A072 TaxID=3461146 RepID=UPI004042F63E
MTTESLLLLLGAGLWAGVQNALAGGGSFLTLPALMLAGLDARAANITSTVALFPAQVTMGLVNRRMVAGIGGLSFRTLFWLSLAGGGVGALLLLLTPSDIFRQMLPWLVLVATLLFARGAFGGRIEMRGLSKGRTVFGQVLVAIYGGYFGGGIGFLMLALFTLAGTALKEAQANKNALAAVMNLSATIVFAVSGEVEWLSAAVLSGGAIAGGWLGAHAIRHVPDRPLKVAVVLIGLTLAAGLFWKG